MRSFTLWYSAKDNVKLEKEVTVHVNLWDKEEKTSTVLILVY